MEITLIICITIIICVFFVFYYALNIQENELKHDIECNNLIHTLDKVRYTLKQINKEYLTESTYKYIEDAIFSINKVIVEYDKQDDKQDDASKAES